MNDFCRGLVRVEVILDGESEQETTIMPSLNAGPTTTLWALTSQSSWTCLYPF